MPKRRKAAGVPRKVILDPDISTRLDAVLATSRQTLSGFVQDAIVQRLARWEPAAAFIDRKRRKLGKGRQSGFDLAACHASGWPLKVPATFWQQGEPADQIVNLRSLLLVNPIAAQKLLEGAWAASGLGHFGAKEWEATQEWYRSLEAQHAEIAEDQMPEGWGQ